MFKEVFNKTPHPVDFKEQMQDFSISPEGEAPRMVETVHRQVGDWQGVPIFEVSYGQVENLPDEDKDVGHIVGLPTALALLGKRKDILVPYGFVRDENGRILGCTALARPVKAPGRIKRTVRKVKSLVRGKQ